MGEASVIMACALVFGAIVFFVFWGIDAVTKVETKRKQDTRSKQVKTELKKLDQDLKKLRSNKTKTVNSLRKDIKKLRGKVSKLDKENNLNLGQVEQLGLIKLRLSLLEDNIKND